MPKFWLLLLSIFHLFSLSPAGRQMGDLLLGTENVMERVSSHPTMRTGCSCDISLQIEGECSGVPNGTFLGLLYFHDILESPPRSLWKNLVQGWQPGFGPLCLPHNCCCHVLDLFSFFLFLGDALKDKCGWKAGLCSSSISLEFWKHKMFFLLRKNTFCIHWAGVLSNHTWEARLICCFCLSSLALQPYH